jgi:hypothetical protein
VKVADIIVFPVTVKLIGLAAPLIFPPQYENTYPELGVAVTDI